jgi:hypothetical protein
MSTIQAMAARARRECDTNGLPAGEYTYSDPLKIENRYQSEAGAIAEKYGSVANWRLWDPYTFIEINTGKYLFDTDIRELTGVSLKDNPEKAIALIDQSKILVKKRW